MTLRTNLRFALALAAGIALVTAGCSGTNSVTSSSTGNGQVKVEMGATSGTNLSAATSGGTMASLSSLEVTVASLRARMTDGTWQDVPGAYPMAVDVLALAAAGEVTIGDGLLPEGSYDALEVVVSGATATLSDGAQIAISFPPPGRAVLLSVDFEVVEGEQTFIDIRLRMDISFEFANGEMSFEPEFEIEVDAEDD